MFFFYFYANVQRNVTWGIYYCLTIELDHAKRDSRLTSIWRCCVTTVGRFDLRIKVCIACSRLSVSGGLKKASGRRVDPARR